MVYFRRASAAAPQATFRLTKSVARLSFRQAELARGERVPRLARDVQFRAQDREHALGSRGAPGDVNPGDVLLPASLEKPDRAGDLPRQCRKGEPRVVGRGGIVLLQEPEGLGGIGRSVADQE